MPIVLMLVFLAATGLVAGVFMLLTSTKGNLYDRHIRRMAARRAAREAETRPPASLLRKDIVDQSSKFRKQLKELSNATRLTHLLAQSGTDMSTTTFFLLTVILAGVLAGVAWFVWPVIFTPPIGLMAGAAMPYLYVRFKVSRRLKTITEQFPDALEMLVSSLRSGQAFATGLSTVANEMPEPIASEFQMAFDEQNFGVAMTDALEHLRDRVDTLDMEFFVTAITIQRETGGNLAEILDNLGTTIRGRIKLLGQIRTLTAQGRLSGWIVGALPIVLGGALYFLNPSYIGQLFSTTLGNYLMGAGVALQFLGFMLIQKIVNIKV